MKTSIKAIIAIAIAGVFAVAAQAQTTQPKVAVVNMLNLFEGHYKTVEQRTKLQSDMQQAEGELQKMGKDIQAIAEQLKALEDQFKNPALAESAKNKIQEQFQVKLQEFQQKQNDGNNFRMTTQRAIQDRNNTFRAQLVSEIGEVINAIAKEKGVNMVLDVSGASLNSVPTVIYNNGMLDLTKDVADRINKTRPADAPAVSFPGAK